jgi:hypothetical protein
MEPNLNATTLLRKLEEQLLQPDTRRCADQLDHLLADEFVEFGSSGRVFNKVEIIESLKQEPSVLSVQRSISDFSAKWLTPEIVLVTYRLLIRRGDVEDEAHSLRSSIWKAINGHWQMIFHQGTSTGRE